MLAFGRFDDRAFFGVNYRALPNASQQAYKAAKQAGSDKPFFVGEFWSGRSMHWGEPFYRRPPAEIAEAFREALELGGHVCFYMFAGGTNFGFMGGANIGRSYSPRPNTPVRYIPHTTSYDVDALIGEDGTPREKYFLCRDVLDEYLGNEKREHLSPASEKQSVSVILSETAALFENLDALTEKKDFTLLPKPMEDHGQNYGLILYSTILNALQTQPTTVYPPQFRDRATIFVDGEFLAVFTRDRGMTKIADGLQKVAEMPVIAPNGLPRKIDVLVENTGRVNFSAQIAAERKGLESALTASNALLYGYETRTLPLQDLSHLSWSKRDVKEHSPCFFKGRFAAKKDIDTYVDFSNFDHGYIWLNGFNLGRYDSAGPQMTLYVPGVFLKEEDNEIIVLDMDPTGDNHRIVLRAHEILEGDASELS
jgi:beta-galactosidase